MRKFTSSKLLIGSHNKGKVREIQELLKPFGLEVISAADLGMEEPDETEDSFGGNALLKATYCAKHSNLPSLADDSGLVIPALNGAPGIYSARWAGPERDFTKAMGRVEDELKDKDDHSAHFICCLALAWPDGHSEIFTGRWDGTLIFPPRAQHGFGYDPIFVPKGYDKTVAEMKPEQKYALSHRAQAFKQLVEGCFL
jgi:XTP/dITP diphosphohydrolase